MGAITLQQALAGLVLAALICDAATTLVAFDTGRFAEINPLMRAFINAAGLVPALIVTHAAFAIYLVFDYANWRVETLLSSAIILWCVVVWNIWQLTKGRTR